MALPRVHKQFTGEHLRKVHGGFVWIAALAGLTGCGARSELDLGGRNDASVVDSGVTDNCTRLGTCTTQALAKCSSEPVFYAISSDSVLYRLNPETLNAERLGYLDCPSRPISMTIARDGTPWLGSRVGWLMHGKANDLTCVGAYLLSQQEASVNGMGLEVDVSGTEHLFVAPNFNSSTVSLMDFDPATSTLRGSMALNKSYDALELVGNGMGELFAIGSDYANRNEVTLMQLDPVTAKALWQLDVSAVAPQGFCNGCDVAYWNHRLYVFNGLTSYGDEAGVWRYSMANHELSYLGTLPFLPVGVDSPPCAE